MKKSIIYKIHNDFKETKRFDLPDYLLPSEKGYNLINWARELFLYYQEAGIIVRAFDDLPLLRISSQPSIDITIQDLHKFITSDMNLIPLKTRKTIIGHAISNDSPQAAWNQIALILLEQIKGMEKETVLETLSWKFSPVAEILWALTWFFMERLEVVPPRSANMKSVRFPYYLWLTEEKTPCMWEPENPLCRWEWLALDLYNKQLKQEPQF